MKLIKINPAHYVIVDNSEIKCPSIVTEKLIDGTWGIFQIDTINDIDNNQKNITHSTLSIEGIKHIPLSNIKELLGHNQSLEDNKKIYTEEDMIKTIKYLRTHDKMGKSIMDLFEEINNHLNSKTEWDIQIINDTIILI